MKKLKYTKFTGINQDGNRVWSMEEKQQYKKMKKNKALSKIIKSSLICRECGRSSPNPYGECLCSYDMNMFTDINWSLVADKLYEKE